MKLGVEDREEALLANFQVRPVLIDRVLDAQMNDEEIQELIKIKEIEEEERLQNQRIRWHAYAGKQNVCAE